MFKKKNLFALLLTCGLGLGLASCAGDAPSTSDPTTNGDPTTSEPDPTTPAPSEPVVTNVTVTLDINEAYAEDVTATVKGVTSGVVLSSGPTGTLYSTDFVLGETVEVSAVSATGKFIYSYWVSETDGDATLDEDVYLDELGAGSFVLDGDSAVVTLIGMLNEEWEDPDQPNENDKLALDYYDAITASLGFDGEYMEVSYIWEIDATGEFETAKEVADYVSAWVIPLDFYQNGAYSEDDNNLIIEFIEATETFMIDLYVVQDETSILAQLELYYISGDVLPDPNSGSSNDGESLILDYYYAISDRFGEGKCYEYFYSWTLDATGLTALEAADLIGSDLPTAFSLKFAESQDEFNISHYYVDNTNTCLVLVSIFPEVIDDEEVLTATIELSYKDNIAVPNPNETGETSLYETIIKEIVFNLTGETGELDVTYWAHRNGEKDWWYTAYEYGYESYEAAVQDAILYLPANVTPVDGEYYDYSAEEGYVLQWCMDDTQKVSVDIQVQSTETEGAYLVLFVVYPF